MSPLGSVGAGTHLRRGKESILLPRAVQTPLPQAVLGIYHSMNIPLYNRSEAYKLAHILYGRFISFHERPDGMKLLFKANSHKYLNIKGFTWKDVIRELEIIIFLRKNFKIDIYKHALISG